MTSLLHRWTIEDYHRIVETGVLANANCELLRGEIVDMPPEGPEHAHRCETTARYLERLFGEGCWSRQGKPITLGDSEPQPDIAIVRQKDYSDRHPTPQDVLLIVEYSRTTQKQDRGTKKEIYAEARIPHYLVVDLKATNVTHYAEPANGQYTREQTKTGGTIAIGAIEAEVQRLLG